ncbi:uncharacterized protein L3040_003220 [Drepanopeziza brunnea f. sp. 'multigermtubi']|uniref:uncharacterized protein n=1 Tax=Drepanopeziza brunnea f. sp. 'multigermtubi' TaxID=698441 RepID=UPI002395566B|nr:hypothetical protein L3040_003220 [Drepanopeziza brunnea f. sp. 'multigermtubi']
MSSHDPGCPFCNIATFYPPSPTPSANHDQTTPSSFVVLSTTLCVAFLDIMPLSPGHLLITTRAHREKISDVNSSEAAELGIWVSRLSRVMARVTGVWDWNIVQNNGAAASQVVPHVHYHLVPRPNLDGEARNRSFTMFGKGQRSELDDGEAAELVGKVKGELERELKRIEREKL